MEPPRIENAIVPAANATNDAAASPEPTGASPAAVYLNGLAPSGQRAQRAALRAFALMLGYVTPFEVRWTEITGNDIRSIRARLRTLYEGATVNRMISALRGVLRIAHGGALPVTLTEDLKGSEPNAPPPGRNLGAVELGKLFSAARPSQAGIRDAAIVAVMYGSGLRRDSICKLDLADVGADAQTITARKAKGGKTYETALHPAMRPFLLRWIEVRSTVEGPLFCRITRWDRASLLRLSVKAISELIEELRLRAGVAPFTPHDFRRTFGTELLDKGVDPIAVARLMGHEDVKMTMRYDRRSVTRLAESLEKLPMPDFEGNK